MPRKPIDPNAPTLIREDHVPTVLHGGVRPDDPTMAQEDEPTRIAEQAPAAPRELAWDMHVMLYAKEGFAAGRIERLNTKGLFVSTPHTLPVDAAVKLELDLPGGIRMVPARVRTLRKELGPDRPAGIGVDFVDLDPIVAEQIRSLLRGNPPSRASS